MKQLKLLISCMAVSLVFSFHSSAQIVDRSDRKIISNSSVLPSYLVLTPRVAGVRGDNFYNDVRALFTTRSSALPDNVELLDGEGWDGSVSFRIVGSPSEILNTRRNLSRMLTTRSISSFDSRIDGVRFPVSNSYTQWFHDSPLDEPGAANTVPTRISETGKGVTIAIIDTGWIQHPDLENSGGFDFITDERSSNDNDEGRDNDPTDEGDFRMADESPRGMFEPSSWHGAHVQGIAAGKLQNDSAYRGIAPDATVLPLRVLGRFGGRDQDILDSINWAIGEKVPNINVSPSQPVNIINLSLGAESDSCPDYYNDVFKKARERGVTIVVAAGNDNMEVDKFTPANCDNVIVVSSNTREGRRSNYSNFGKQITISAPGGEKFKDFLRDGEILSIPTPESGILSTVYRGAYNYNRSSGSEDYIYKPYEGTSMAAPVVSGVIALMQEVAMDNKGRFLRPVEVENILKQTARSFPSTSMNTCDTNRCGAGIVDAVAALEMIKEMPHHKEVPAGEDEQIPILPVDTEVPKCLSSYEIIKRLMGEEAANKIGKPDDSYVGDCP